MLVSEDQQRAGEACIRLARVGIEAVEGYLAGGVEAWPGEARPLARVLRVPVRAVYERMAGDPEGCTVVDVRRPAEWRDGHVAGAVGRQHVEHPAAALFDPRRVIDVFHYFAAGHGIFIAQQSCA